LENVAGGVLDPAAALHRDLRAPRLHLHVRLRAQEGVASDSFSGFHRLQQKCSRLCARQGQESGNRRQQVGGDGLGHRHQRGFSRQTHEFGVIRAQHLLGTKMHIIWALSCQYPVPIRTTWLLHVLTTQSDGWIQMKAFNRSNQGGFERWQAVGTRYWGPATDNWDLATGLPNALALTGIDV